jgi:hypothetical protein
MNAVSKVEKTLKIDMTLVQAIDQLQKRLKG